jgi:hypothetical protein
MRYLSGILLYTLLSSSAARAGPLSRSERLRKAYLGTPSDDSVVPDIHARQEVDDGTTPTPIFSTIVPDAPESTTTPPSSSATGDNGDAYREDNGSLTSSSEPNPLSSQVPDQGGPPDTTRPVQDLSSTTSIPDTIKTETEAPIPSSEQAFLPPISSRISIPPSLPSSQPADGPSSLIEPSSAAPEVTPTTTFVTESQSEPISESSTVVPGDNGAGNGSEVTPTPIFSTISAGPATTDQPLSFVSSLQLPIGEHSTTVAEPEEPSSALLSALPSSASTASVGPSTSISQPSQLPSSAPATESLLSSALPVDDSSRPLASTTRSITDRPLFTTTVGIPPASEASSSTDLAVSSSPLEESLPAASSGLPASTTSLISATVTTLPLVTPTGEPDPQVPTNRGPPNASATSSIPPERFQANLEQARAFHESFKPLTEQSACFGQQAACINGGIAQCQPEQGQFDIKPCNDPNEECFPLPLVFEDGVKLSCTDPVEARRILGIEEDDSPPVVSTTTPPTVSTTPSGDQVVTVTERPIVTEIVATETVDNGVPSRTSSAALSRSPSAAPSQSPSTTPLAEDVVTVTETPTITLVVTETVPQPGAEETTAPPPEVTTTQGEPGQVTTTVGGGVVTLTTFITVQPPPPEPTEPASTQLITITITALPSSPPDITSDVAEAPLPTPSAQPETGGGSGDDGRGDEDDNDDGGNDDEDGDDPLLTSLNIIIIPTTLLTTTIRATPPAEQALATPIEAAAPTVTTTVTEIVSVPVLVTVTQREVRLEQATVTATVTQAA